MTTTRRRWLMLSVLTFGLIATATVTYTTAAGAESNGGVRVMPLGDSITEGTQVPGGYRIGLWQRLAAGGYRNDFVGSQFNGPANLGDHDHEGHPGWRIDQIDASVNAWLSGTTPRSVLLHIGTNDVLQNYSLSGAPNRLSTLIDHITATAPNADVFVATITPLSSATQESAARTFNATIPGIVQGKVNAGKRVHLVDMHAALTTADLIDGIHPTAGGYDKMAAVWYNALRAVPGSIGSPGGATTPPTSPSATTPAPGGACAATYRTVGSWSGGYQGEVTVRAGTSPINGWTVRWTLAGGQSVSQVWNGTLAVTGSSVSVKNAEYNGSLPGSGSATFGFIGAGTASSPVLACTSP